MGSTALLQRQKYRESRPPLTSTLHLPSFSLKPLPLVLLREVYCEPCSCEWIDCSLLPFSSLGVTEAARTPRWVPSRSLPPGHSRDRPAVPVPGRGTPRPAPPRGGSAQCACAAAAPLLQGRGGVGQSGPRRPHAGGGLPVPVRPLPATATGLSPSGLPALRSVLRPVANRQRGLPPGNGAVTFNCTPDVSLREPLGASRDLQVPEQPPCGPPPPAGPVASQWRHSPHRSGCQISPLSHAASVQTHPEPSSELNQPVTKLSWSAVIKLMSGKAHLAHNEATEILKHEIKGGKYSECRLILRNLVSTLCINKCLCSDAALFDPSWKRELGLLGFLYKHWYSRFSALTKFSFYWWLWQIRSIFQMK